MQSFRHESHEKKKRIGESSALIKPESSSIGRKRLEDEKDFFGSKPYTWRTSIVLRSLLVASRTYVVRIIIWFICWATIVSTRNPERNYRPDSFALLKDIFQAKDAPPCRRHQKHRKLECAPFLRLDLAKLLSRPAKFMNSDYHRPFLILGSSSYHFIPLYLGLDTFLSPRALALSILHTRKTKLFLRLISIKIFVRQYSDQRTRSVQTFNFFM